MKVMQINVVYKTGSTGRIVYDIHQHLIKEGIESVVCYGRGKSVLEANVYKAAPEFLLKMQSLRSRITGYAYSGCFFSTLRVIHIIRREKPDVVHLHCINGYFVNIYKLMNFLKTEKINTVLTLHAEFMHTAGCSYSYECNQWKAGCCEGEEQCLQFNKLRPKSWFFNRCNREWYMMRTAFDGFTNLVICPVSDWLKERAAQSPFMSDKHMITVTNGVDTSKFKLMDRKHLADKHKITNEKVILHVTPNFLSEIKGGKYVLEIANRLLDENIKIIIVGYNGDGQSLPQNIITVPRITDVSLLAEYYSLADITLLTSMKETFSMICAESLCCGTPVVGFEAGAPETISMKEYSEFVPQGNVDMLKEAILKWCEIYRLSKKQIEKSAKIIYSKEAMNKKYNKVYKGYC